MEANSFIAKLKACGTDNDISNLKEALDRFKVILVSLPSKDKGSFGLNVLCTLCRNLEKVPSWRAAINNTDLTTFCIECVRHTRTLPQAELVKTLACVYHLHKHIIRQSSKVPPELILKLSFMPFECDEESLLSNYYKTYWSILADRLTYMEKLKTMRIPVNKLLLKFIEDVIKVIKIYDTVQFCANLITYLIKKIHSIYNDDNINDYVEKIFECVSKKDLDPFKTLPEKDILDIYIKFNDCLYVVSDNCLKNNDSALSSISRFCIIILGHRLDMFHCLQTVYSNAFCCIINDKTNINLIENVLKCLVNSFEITEKLGYERTMLATYPYISQLLRLYIENIVNNVQTAKYFNEAIQSNCLKLILYLIPKLKTTNQLLKCENCNIKTGLHDALRLTFLVKNVVTVSTNNNYMLHENLPLYFKVIEHQYSLLNELNGLGCGNYNKCLTKLLTDTHNSAILLNKAKYYEYSIKLFEIYLKNEFSNINDAEKRNISRALYNKSICELDNKLYSDSLNNAFLSLIFSLPEALNNEKHMSLVMDIKAKAAKNITNDSDVQTLSILEACKTLICDNLYGNLAIFIKNLEFSKLLKHEFTMYIKLWPSISPIAGVLKSMYDLTMKRVEWVKKEDQKQLLWDLYEIVVETPTVVRTIHEDTYRRIVYEILQLFEKNPAKSAKEKIVYATLLCLKSEYEFTEASLKYGWKNSETDPDAPGPCVLHEHAAATAARQAVRALLKGGGGDIPSQLLGHCLQVLQVCLIQLLQLCECVGALQLAWTCCELAEVLEDRVTFIRNAGLLIYNADRQHTDIQNIINKSGEYCKEISKNPQHLDVALNFICEVAIYYSKCGKFTISSKLVQSVQAQILSAHDVHPDINLDLSLGRLMEAQTQLCSDADSVCPSTLSALNTTHRYYLSLVSGESRWSLRRWWCQCVRARAVCCGARCVRVSRALRVWRRARASAAGVRGAVRRAVAAGDVLAAGGAGGGDAQIKIDNCLKYVLGLEHSSPTASNDTKVKKPELFTPKQPSVETMRDCLLKKTQVSPSLPCIAVPGFQLPKFLFHDSACACHLCELPACTVIACMICYLEASMYYRAKEMEIARNYFDGALKAFQLAEVKLRDTFKRYKEMSFKEFVVDIEKEKTLTDFKHVQLEFLIEMAYFELSLSDFKTSDEYVVRIHDIMSEVGKVDPYLCNEVYNLMIASAELRKSIKKPKETELEVELENLKLSPNKNNELQKTPESKAVIPKMATNKIVKDEDIPKKRKVIKLNLDEAIEDDKIEEKVTRSKTKKPQFKIPVPVTSKPVLENMTPRPTRSRPEIVIQQPSLDLDYPTFTPKTTASEFFTPSQSTPGEQFFTPMTSLKTYSKRIVKNLEEEFSTPKGKENTLQDKRSKSKVETGSVRVLKDKKVLKRATSPGKLVPEISNTRPRRIRQPILDK